MFSKHGSMLGRRYRYSETGGPGTLEDTRVLRRKSLCYTVLEVSGERDEEAEQ